jgi:hypothetical protein
MKLNTKWKRMYAARAFRLPIDKLLAIIADIYEEESYGKWAVFDRWVFEFIMALLKYRLSRAGLMPVSPETEAIQKVLDENPEWNYDH